MTSIDKRTSLRLTDLQIKKVLRIIHSGEYLKESEILREALNFGLDKILNKIYRGVEGVTKEARIDVGEERKNVKQFGNH
jgi:Arc/MetJ-type ribon-helix-helix transcriptional regulator